MSVKRECDMEMEAQVRAVKHSEGEGCAVIDAAAYLSQDSTFSVMKSDDLQLDIS